MAHGREIKNSPPTRSSYAGPLMLHWQKSRRILKNFCKRWRWLVLKSTGNESICGSALHRNTAIPGDYTEQAIRERIAGTRKVTPRRTSYKKPAQKIGMLVDIEAALRAGKGPGYERWAKVFNIKQLFQAVLYLKEHGDMNYAELKEKSDSTTANFNAVSAQIKELESKMNANAELQKQIVNYAKTRAVYVEYRKAGYSKKFRSAHEADILLHQAAKKYFDELGITKLPSVKGLREEYAALLEQKRKAYSAYKQARDDMKELHNVRANVEYLLEIRTEPESQRSTEKDRH